MNPKANEYVKDGVSGELSMIVKTSGNSAFIAYAKTSNDVMSPAWSKPIKALEPVLFKHLKLSKETRNGKRVWIDTSLSESKEKRTMKKFDDVHIKSKNLTGMIYAIQGNTLVVKTVKGLVKTTKDDVELIATESIMKKSELRQIIREEILREGFETKLNIILRKAGFQRSMYHIDTDKHWDLDYVASLQRTVATFKNSSARDKALKVIEQSNEFNPVKYKDNMITFKRMNESKQHGLKEGFTGWSHWNSSDGAADLMATLSSLVGYKAYYGHGNKHTDGSFDSSTANANASKIVKALKRALSDWGDRNNLDGAENIGLIAKSDTHFWNNLKKVPGVSNIAKKAIRRIESRIEHPDRHPPENIMRELEKLISALKR